jgi:hypothetical protein
VEVHVTRSPALPPVAPLPLRRLDPGLRALVDEGFELVADHVVLARFAPTAPPWRRTIFPAAAYYEGSVNHVHVEHELETGRGRRSPRAQAVTYAYVLAHALAASHPERSFDVWAAFGEESVVRFHEQRADEHGWPLPDGVAWLRVHVG